MDDFVWIQTRDSSPTLWSNELGEPFRSSRGAFTESWNVFVAPLLSHAQARGLQKIQVAEFGLGTGLNWLLLSLACRSRGLVLEYMAIERDTRSFEMGLQKWREFSEELAKFLQAAQIDCNATSVGDFLATFAAPQIFASLESAAAEPTSYDFWFHDPFGFSVNPDGYSLSCLKLCSRLWSPELVGFSYACNRVFQDTLRELGCQILLSNQSDLGLKRERLEFRRLSC
jgi:tRNA U34 5-methylaminomethyl-2-thiouridine-forming methyltransferase MnmC